MGDAAEDHDALNRKRSAPGDKRRRPWLARVMTSAPASANSPSLRHLSFSPATVVPPHRPREVRLLTDAVLAGDKLARLFTQRHKEVEDPGLDDLIRVAPPPMVLKSSKLPDGSNSLSCMAWYASHEELWLPTRIGRAVVNRISSGHPSLELEALVHNARQIAREVIELSPMCPTRPASSSTTSTARRRGRLPGRHLSLGASRNRNCSRLRLVDRLKKVRPSSTTRSKCLRLRRRSRSTSAARIDKTQRDFLPARAAVKPSRRNSARPMAPRGRSRSSANASRPPVCPMPCVRRPNAS